MIPLLATACVLLAVPGLALRRSGALPARAFALLTMVVLAVICLDPPVVVRREVAARIAIAASDAGAELPDRLTGVAFQTAAVAGTRFPVRDAGAALAAGPRADELLVLWNGPAPLPAGAVFANGRACTTVPVLPFAPDELRVGCQQPLVAGRPALLEVSAGHGQAAQARLTVRDAGQVLAETSVTITADRVAEVPVLPMAAGTLAVELVVEAAGHVIRRAGTLPIEPAPRVLVLDPTGNAAAALRAQGVAVETANELPPDLVPFAAVVLAGPVPEPVQAKLAQAVDAGLGLLVLGPALPQPTQPLAAVLPIHPIRTQADAKGTAAPGPAQPSPPPTQPPATEPPPPEPKVTPRDPPVGRTGDAELDPAGPSLVDVKSIAMVLLVDRSGSMGQRLDNGEIKMSYAKTSALETARALGPGDTVAVLTFGNKLMHRVELPLTDANDREQIARGIERLAAANEGTYALSALRAAVAMLGQSKAAVKHVVIISDGEIFDLPVMVLDAPPRGSSHVTVSIISIVDNHTNSLFKSKAQELAEAWGGEFFAATNAKEVPVLVSAQVARSLDRVGRKRRSDDGTGEGLPAPLAKAPPPKEPPKAEPPKPATRPEPPLPAPAARVVVRAVADSALLQPMPADSWPTLGGAVRCTAPLDAHVLLVAGDEGSPLLAFGNRGLGRAAVFAADLGGPDGAEFRADRAFPGRFSQWVAALLRPLPVARAIDCLGPATVTPVAPTGAELAALATAVGAPVEPLANWTPPPPRVEFAAAGQAVGWAVAAVLALALLAAFEGFASRRWP